MEDARNPKLRILGAMLGFTAASAILAGLFPMGFAILIVCLFAGPHNWAELRFLLARTPTGMGPLRPYFLVAAAGVAAISAGSVGIAYAAGIPGVSYDHILRAFSIWSTGFVLWVLVLVWMREGQKPVRSWPAARPVGLALIVLAWFDPPTFSFVLVYGHPLVSLWILDRELYRRKSPARAIYRGCLASVPLFVGLIAWLVGNPAPLANVDAHTRGILIQGGANLFPLLPDVFCVAVHAFLEMLHYGVWLVAFPLASEGSLRAVLDPAWLSNRFPKARTLIRLLLAFSTLMVLVLWISFCVDPAWTRQIYFTLAVIHVISEIPALLRMI